MEDSKIALKLEEETKGLGKIAEKLEDTIKYEFDKGIEQIDVEEMGKAIDMLKDVYEAKEKLVKSCFYAYTLEEMEKQSEEGGEDEEIMDDKRRGYRGQPRSKTSGRFMSRGDGRRSNGRRGYEDMMMYDDMDYDEMERMRDMDRMSYGRMGYSGSGSSGGSSSGMSSGGSSSGGMSGGSMGSQGGSNSGSRGYSESRYDRARRGYEETKAMHKDNSSESKQMKMKSLEDYTKEIASDITDMVQDMSAEEKNLLRTKLQTLAQKVS